MSVRLQNRVIAMVAGAILLASCDAPPSDALRSTRAWAARTSETLGDVVRHGRVVLPPGVAYAPGALHVTNSLGSQQLARDGSFDLVAYRGGPQFTLVTNDAGDPILAGFVGRTRTTIDTVSTAEVLLFFAAGDYALPQPFRRRAIDTLASTRGFERVERALAATLRIDATALARRTNSDEALTSAIDGYVANRHATARSIARETTSRPASRTAVRALLRRVLVPLASAVLVPIDSPSIDAIASVRASPASIDHLTALVIRRVPAIVTFVRAGQTGDALFAAYTTIVGSDAAHAALFATVRGDRDAVDHRSDGVALYDAASSIFATWDVLGSAFASAPTAVVSERTVATTR